MATLLRHIQLQVVLAELVVAVPSPAAVAELAFQRGDGAIGLRRRLGKAIADVAERTTQIERRDVVRRHLLLDRRRNERISRADRSEALRIAEAARVVARYCAPKARPSTWPWDRSRPPCTSSVKSKVVFAVGDVPLHRCLQQVALDEGVLALTFAALHEQRREVRSVQLAVLERTRRAIRVERGTAQREPRIGAVSVDHAILRYRRGLHVVGDVVRRTPTTSRRRVTEIEHRRAAPAARVAIAEAVFFRELAGPHEVAAITRERQTARDRRADVFVVALAALAVLHAGTDTFESAVELEVDDTPPPPPPPPATASEPYAADAPPVTISTRSIRMLGNEIGVDRALCGRSNESLAIHQHQRARRAQTSQVQHASTDAAARALLGGWIGRGSERRQLVERVADIRDASLLETFRAHYRDRRRCREPVRTLNARSGNDDLR